ncbi:hypothetical protein ELY21_07685 [Legionella sp. km535]|uniref:hypothetical protein n=1 Tax=Legionella sp. km535 TaxID=2498107 RepID=UPI000F8E7A04|nr:hypothetical protein [Legionella sp. km535]RUR18569.1 hypothetical protein ELY21_07685 [Legionella sp. km535]
MSQVEHSYTDFKNDMIDTVLFSISPFTLFFSLFNVSAPEKYYGLVRVFSLFFALISSPILILAIPVTLTFGAIAAVAQMVFFPFQLVLAMVQDLRSVHIVNNKQGVMADVSKEPSGLVPDEQVSYPSSGAHFPTLFSNEKAKDTNVIDEISVASNPSPNSAP